MIKQGVVPPGTRIRVFFPNPLPGTYQGNPKNLISEEYEVSYLEVLDPIYHELVFIDPTGIRHRIVGLAYHLQEAMPDSGGIDGQA